LAPQFIKERWRRPGRDAIGQRAWNALNGRSWRPSRRDVVGLKKLQGSAALRVPRPAVPRPTHPETFTDADDRLLAPHPHADADDHTRKRRILNGDHALGQRCGGPPN